MSNSTDDKYSPVTAADVTDEKLMVGEFRAFRVEVRDNLDAIRRALETLARIEQRMDVVIDRQNTMDSRLGTLEQRVITLEHKTSRRAPRRKK